MKRKIIGLVLLIMIAFTTSVFASNWVYVCNWDTNKETYYIDTESVVKSENGITYWYIIEFEKPNASFPNVKRILWKEEAQFLNPPQSRYIEYYDYDSNNRELGRFSKSGNWATKIDGNSPLGIMMNFAIKYAKDVPDTGQKPILQQ